MGASLLRGKVDSGSEKDGMASTLPMLSQPRALVTYSSGGDALANEHDRVTRSRLAQRIADLLGIPYEGAYDGSSRSGPFFFVPGDTLTTSEAAGLGIVHERQFYGGAVPFPHVATKTISHGLLTTDSSSPAGWQPDLGAMLEDCVLRGYSVFSSEDALKAGKEMLITCPVRIKIVQETGGRGQTVVSSQAELESLIASLDIAKIEENGLVIEENLTDVATYSVGVTSLAGDTIAYWGGQKLTTNNLGGKTYGGSDLNVVRGSFEALLELDISRDILDVIKLAQRYELAAFAAYSGLFASRRNYDVAVGSDFRGRRRTGVLEQSWRIGGCSGAEIAALETFRSDATLTQLRSSTTEVFGESDPPPAHATVYYRGNDPVAGPITKYAMIEL